MFASPKFRRFYEAVMRRYRLNLCRPVVRGIASRLDIDGWDGDDGMAEIKCPGAPQHVAYLLGQYPTKYRLQVQGGLVAGGEDAGALHRDVDAQIAPRKRLGVTLGGHLDGTGAHVDGVAVDGDLRREMPVHGIVPQQVGIGFHRAEVGHGDHLDVGPTRLDDGAQHVAADAAKPVDADAYGHDVFSPRLLVT